MRGRFTLSSAGNARGGGHARRARGARARALVLSALLVCMPTLIPLRAAMATNTITDWSGLRSAPRGWFGFEVGPVVSLPLPVASANREQVGLDAGVSFTAKLSRFGGLGADVAYHYWPVSTQFKQKFSDLLREGTLNTLMLGGGTWGLRVVQVGGHIRVHAPATRGVRPWLQLGASVYRVDPRISGFSGDAGFFRVTVSSPPPVDEIGASVAVGTDLVGGPHARMGVDANYHFVYCREMFRENLHVFTLGVHALFGT